MSRSSRRADRADRELKERLERLRRVHGLAAAERGPERLPDELVGSVGETVSRAETRLGRGADRTVVALAGATGSGKSSLFNALVGADLAQVGVRRPTTGTARAAAFDRSPGIDEGTAELLDWLAVSRRHAVRPGDGPDLAGLVLLDLPDHDSVEADHRAEVDRLVEVVDTFVWVVDPQKYADAALHERYLRRFAGHAAVTVVVLNQVDLVPDNARPRLLDDLGRILGDDGLRGVRIVTTSTRTGEGLAELRRELAARTAERRALVARLDADLDWLTRRLEAEVGERDPEPAGAPARRSLADAFARAAGADGVADAVGHAHRRRAAQAVGWPPTRWVGRLRPDPLRRLGLDRHDGDGVTAAVGRTSRPAPSAVAEAGLRTAVRSFVDASAVGLPDLWRERVATVAADRRDDVADALDRRVATAELPTGRPSWWTAVSTVQWLLAGLMVAGLAWLLVIGVVGWFRLPDLPTPEVGAVPWPTALALGGAVLGLLVSVLARFVAAAGARRRSAATRRMLVEASAETAELLVAGPVDAELAELSALRREVLGLGA